MAVVSVVLWDYRMSDHSVDSMAVRTADDWAGRLVGMMAGYWVDRSVVR